MWAKHKQQSGFTIVELLIVIVVIGILAAITIVAYNDIQQRARASAASSALTQASKKIAVAQVDDSSIPTCAVFYTLMTTKTTDIPTAPSCSFVSGDVTYQYKQTPSSNPTGYCITATNGSTSYKLESTGTTTPALGFCNGHGSGGVPAITNLMTNPSVEADIVGWSGVNDAVLTRQPTAALHGGQGVRIVTSSSVDSGARINTGTFAVSAGTQYTASVSIRATTAASYSLSIQNTGGTANRHIQSLSAGQTSRFFLTWTPTTSGIITFYALKQANQSGTSTFDVDGAMLVSDSTASVYADGTTPGWDWTGAVHNSTSVGPPQ